MSLKKACLTISIINLFTATLTCFAGIYSGQTLQINTYLNSLIGNPSWTLIIRDAESQRVLPYLFEFNSKNNFWVAFSAARSYIVTVSTIKWGPYAVINNFCNLENGILTEQSMIITLKGELSPNPDSFKCTVQKYNIPIVLQDARF